MMSVRRILPALLGQYQGWEGVENAALAIAEFAALVLQPGRLCSNGKACRYRPDSRILGPRIGQDKRCTPGV